MRLPLLSPHHIRPQMRITSWGANPGAGPVALFSENWSTLASWTNLGGTTVSGGQATIAGAQPWGAAGVVLKTSYTRAAPSMVEFTVSCTSSAVWAIGWSDTQSPAVGNIRNCVGIVNPTQTDPLAFYCDNLARLGGWNGDHSSEAGPYIYPTQTYVIRIYLLPGGGARVYHKSLQTLQEWRPLGGGSGDKVASLYPAILCYAGTLTVGTVTVYSFATSYIKEFPVAMDGYISPTAPYTGGSAFSDGVFMAVRSESPVLPNYPGYTAGDNAGRDQCTIRDPNTGIYYRYYCGQATGASYDIYLAISKDNVRFHRYHAGGTSSSKLISRGTTGTYDSQSADFPRVYDTKVVGSTRYRMTYYCNNTTGVQGTAYAAAPAPYGPWTKYGQTTPEGNALPNAMILSPPKVVNGTFYFSAGTLNAGGTTQTGNISIYSAPAHGGPYTLLATSTSRTGNCYLATGTSTTVGGNTCTADTAANAQTFAVGEWVVMTDGYGGQQLNRISAINTSTGVITVERPWFRAFARANSAILTSLWHFAWPTDLSYDGTNWRIFDVPFNIGSIGTAANNVETTGLWKGSDITQALSPDYDAGSYMPLPLDGFMQGIGPLLWSFRTCENPTFVRDTGTGDRYSETPAGGGNHPVDLMAGVWYLDAAANASQSDAAGNGDNGTPNGTITSVASKNMGTQLHFDGSTGYVSIPNSTRLAVPANAPVWLSCWHTPDSGVTGIHGLVAKGTHAGGGFALYWSTADLAYKFVIQDASNNSQTVASQPVATPDGSTRHFVAAGYDPGTGDMWIAVDDKVVDYAQWYVSGVPGVVQDNSGGPLEIGRITITGSTFYCKGAIDAVSLGYFIGTKHGFGGDDYELLYLGGQGGQPALGSPAVSNLNAGLIGAWNLDEAAGVTRRDCTGYRGHLSETAGPISTTTGPNAGVAITFNGSTQYLTGSDRDSWRLTPDQEVQLWFKATALPANSTSVVLVAKDDGTHHEWLIELTTTSGGVTNVVATSGDWGGVTTVTDSVSIAAGTWYQVTVQRNSVANVLRTNVSPASGFANSWTGSGSLNGAPVYQGNVIAGTYSPLTVGALGNGTLFYNGAAYGLVKRAYCSTLNDLNTRFNGGSPLAAPFA